VGDLLYIATDAFAEWMVRAVATSDGTELWSSLSDLDDPVVFTHLVNDLRSTRAMKNDDVTLMRVELTESDPDLLLVVTP
jgi:predicted MarR family transcription regulator